MGESDNDNLIEPLPGVGGTYTTDYIKQEITLNKSNWFQRILRFLPLNSAAGAEDSEGYGTDPNLINPRSPWRSIMTREQKDIISNLSDIIVPESSGYPAPSQIHIAEFFDDWFSAPYERQVNDKNTILNGLDFVDRVSKEKWSDSFVNLDLDQKKTVIDELIALGGQELTFYRRFRYLLIGAYCTSEAGMRSIGYRGNIALKKPPKVTNEALAVIEEELQKLGI